MARVLRGSVWSIAVWGLVLCSAVARAADPAVLTAEQARIAVVEKVTPTVVAIFAKGGQGGGSGVLISADGYALTNFHVTNPVGPHMKCGLADGRLYDAVIVGIDPTGDVALIKLLGRTDFPYSRLGDSDTVSVGDYTFAMGNPFLLATDFTPTVTYGIVSGTHRYQYPAGTIIEYTDCIQVDTSINPGNSGGPLFNMQGEVVGINGRISLEKRGRVNVGAGYAISINQIKHFMDHLRSGRVVDHATLGATVVTRDDGAVVVANILEQSEAFRRGLRTDDEIVSFAGRPIRSVNQFKNVLGIYPNGWKIPLVYRRDGRKQEVFVRLRSLHRQSELRGDSQEAPPGGKRQPKRDKPDDENKNGKDQPGDKKDDKKDDQKKDNRPMPVRNLQPPRPKPPAEVAKLIIEKPGFSNYYFNQLEQDRVLKGLKGLGDYSQLQGVWKIAGASQQLGAFEFTLADKGAGLSAGGGKQTFYQSLAADAEGEDEPPQTGGLLSAMHHLRLLLSRGPKAFSEFYYVGSEPLDGRGDRVDVLVSELSGAETYWYFRQSDGQFVGFNYYRGIDVDPCEVRFSELAEFSGVRFPKQLLIRYADQESAPLLMERCAFTPRKDEPAAKKEDDVKKEESKKDDVKKDEVKKDDVKKDDVKKPEAK